MTISMHIFILYQGFCFFNISQIWGKGNWMWWVVLFTVHQYLSDIWHCVFQTRHLLATVIHGGTDVNLWWSQCDHLWCNGFAWRGEILTDVGVLGYFWHICHWLIPDSYHTNMQEMSTGVNVLVSCWHESVVHWLIPAGTLSPILAMICLKKKVRYMEMSRNSTRSSRRPTIPNTASGIRSRGERRYSSHMATRTATLPYVGQRSRVKWMSGGWRSRKGVLSWKARCKPSPLSK